MSVSPSSAPSWSEFSPAGASPELSPRLAPDTELLGRNHGSGSIEERYLLGRADGRAVEVSPLLYRVVSGIDGRRSLLDLAAWVSAEYGRRITADQLDYLIEHKLRPLGVIAGPGPDPGSQPTPSPHRPLLGLSVARAVVRPGVVQAAAHILSPLFHLPVVVAVLVAVVTFDSWVLTGPGIGGAVHQVLGTPELLLAMAAVTVVGGAFHELGHASASRHGGAHPGAIGVGIYLLWPVFYNDLNDSYRLSRAGRLRVDLGGVYFNAVFIVALAGAYGVTGHPALLVAIVLQHLAIAQQFLPFLRLDGYYMVSDIAGVPDLFARVRPVLARLVPGRRGAPATSDLRPAARLIVTAWVLLIVPLLAAGCWPGGTRRDPSGLPGHCRQCVRTSGRQPGQRAGRGRCVRGRPVLPATRGVRRSPRRPRHSTGAGAPPTDCPRLVPPFARRLRRRRPFVARRGRGGRERLPPVRLGQRDSRRPGGTGLLPGHRRAHRRRGPIEDLRRT